MPDDYTPDETEDEVRQQIALILRRRGLSIEKLEELLREGLDVRREMSEKYSSLRSLTSKELMLILQRT